MAKSASWADRIGRRVKLRDLHVLEAVAEAHSMTKAAAKLAISVPVVSKAIADLEHAVGAPLLDRSPHGVTPTDYGRALLERCGAAFHELRQGIVEIEALADPAAGEVRIGSTAPLSASFVTTVIDQLSHRYPRMTFHLAVSETELLYQHLAERKVDFLIARQYGYGPLADDQVRFEPLYDDPFVVAAGANHPLVRRRKLRLAELVEEAWALPPAQSPPGTFLLNAFRASGVELPRAKVTTFPYAVRSALLATGHFLTILPRSVLRFPAKHPFLVELPVRLPITSGPIGAATLRTRTLNPVAQRFIEWARHVARGSTL
ncbi:LysR family transcriptional regulator [Bradyrhizobium sp.]|jgi:DNA-binding transcriptional LysR family regulator|uniref:LysR family transcriptional regulator n=1 Tax=Bradyrhizobium sp. TaxID=376 RepID=UPI003C689366